MAGKAVRTGKQSTYAPVWSAGVMGTARWKGDAGNRGRPDWIEVRGFNTSFGGGSGGSRTGSYDEEMKRFEEPAIVFGLAPATWKAGPKHHERMRPVVLIHPR